MTLRLAAEGDKCAGLVGRFTPVCRKTSAEFLAMGPTACMFKRCPFIEGRAVPTRYALSLLAACILMAGGTSPSGAGKAAAHFSTAPQSDESRLKVKAEGEGNQLTVKTEGEAVVVDVHSRSGIGLATIELPAGTALQQIVLRLRLKGLEEFRLSYGRTVITARASNQANGGASPRIIQIVSTRGGGERAITPDSPFWLGVRIVSDMAAPRIPLDDGHFDITLPKDFLREGGRAFSIRWIDFYR